jgi:hypothetical protein
MGEYYALCILQAMKMCIFEVVSHSVDIVNYLVLCGMFAQTSSNLPNCFIALILDLVCEILSW